MQSDFYKKYLRSPSWQSKKAARLEIDNGICVMCGRTGQQTRRGLTCHHISYKNIGNENIYTDLVTLCPSCHLKIHRYYNRTRRKEGGKNG